MSLAAASERIREMEATLGTGLLVRGRRGVQLTAPGSILLQHARAVSEQLQQMRGELDGYAKGLRGNVRLLVNTVAMLEYVPAMPTFSHDKRISMSTSKRRRVRTSCALSRRDAPTSASSRAR